MRKAEPVVVVRKISDLNKKLFVRLRLDQDRVLALAELIEAGKKLPPIEITPDNVILEGRHRTEAHELCERAEIECEIVNIDDEIEMISYAYKANAGGALPPKREDTEHTIVMLLERGANKKQVAELLDLPPSVARKYITEINSKMTRAKLTRAAGAVTDGGLTVAKAAEHYGVDPAKLKELLRGSKKANKPGIAELLRSLSALYRSVSQKNAATARRILEQFEDGDVTAKQVRQVFHQMERLQRNSSRAVADWIKRFDSIATNGHHKETAKIAA